MRIILKFLAAPLVVLLTVLWAVLVFLFCWAVTILDFVSWIAGLIAIVLFITGEFTGGIVFSVISFLVSLFGVPAIAEWMINILEALDDTSKDFITT